MREGVWYPLLGLVVLSWLVLGAAAVIHLKGKVQGHLTWFAGLAAAGFALAAGMYATQGTWIESIVVWVLGWHPAIRLVATLALVVGVAWLVLAAVPDKLASMSMTTALVTMAFFAPMLAEHAAPRGEVGDLVERTVDTSGAFMVDLTSGWFA
jgi:hypothetical protein